MYSPHCLLRPALKCKELLNVKSKPCALVLKFAIQCIQIVQRDGSGKRFGLRFETSCSNLTTFGFVL